MSKLSKLLKTNCIFMLLALIIAINVIIQPMQAKKDNSSDEVSIHVTNNIENKKENIETNKEIIIISTETEFNTELNSPSLHYLIILFNANWSKDSLKLKDSFYNLPSHYKNKSNIELFEIDFKSRSLTKKLSVSTFPSILIIEKTNDIKTVDDIREDNILRYSGELDIKKIYEWINQSTEKILETLTSLTHLDNVLNSFNNVLLLISDNNKSYNDFNDNEELVYSQDDLKLSVNVTETFRQLGDKFPTTPLFRFNNQTLIKYLFYGLKHDNLVLRDIEYNDKSRVVLLKNYDDRINLIPSTYYSDFVNDELFKSINSVIYPVVNYFSQQNFMFVVNSKISHMLLVFKDINNDIVEESKENSENSNNTDIDSNDNNSSNTTTINACDYLNEIDTSYLDDDLVSDKKFSSYNNLNKIFYKKAIDNRGRLFSMKTYISELSQTTLSIDYNIELNELPIILINDYTENGLIRYKITSKELMKQSFLENLIEINNKDKEINNKQIDCLLSHNYNRVFDEFLKNKIPRFLKTEKQPSQLIYDILDSKSNNNGDSDENTTRNSNDNEIFNKIKNLIIDKKEDTLSSIVNQINEKAIAYAKNNIYYLVGSNFDSVINDNSNINYLILFTKRNSGLCREIEKIFSKLAYKLKEESKIKFGIIDLTLNEIKEELDIGNPGIVLYKEIDFDKRTNSNECLRNSNIENTENSLDKYTDDKNNSCNGLLRRNRNDKVVFEDPGVTLNSLIEFLKSNM